jgi:uncharacterized protein YlxW (UPF0749 family)
MMTRLPAIVQATRPCFLGAALFAFALIASASVAGAADAMTGAASPVEEFSQQLEAFQKSVPDLNKSIQDSAGTIDSVTDVEKARAEINRLKDTVSALLGAVSDNGPVSQLGVKALRPASAGHFIVGMTNSAPSLKPEGQRAVTVLVLV